jgi:hypothetical protein
LTENAPLGEAQEQLRHGLRRFVVGSYLNFYRLHTFTAGSE